MSLEDSLIKQETAPSKYEKGDAHYSSALRVCTSYYEATLA